MQTLLKSGSTCSISFELSSFLPIGWPISQFFWRAASCWLPLFQRSSVKIWEMYKPIWRANCTLLSSKELGKFKIFWFSAGKNLLIHIIIKVELKNMNSWWNISETYPTIPLQAWFDVLSLSLSLLHAPCIYISIWLMSCPCLFRCYMHPVYIFLSDWCLVPVPFTVTCTLYIYFYLINVLPLSL